MSDPIKEALNRLPYGFYAITSRNDEDSNAMVANWVMQTSFSPRLIAMGIAPKAYSHSIMSAGGVFAVNIFNKEDQDAMMPFTKGRAKNPDKMKAASFTNAPETGCPILDGAAAYIECKITQIVPTGGDHDIIIGEVIGAGSLKPGKVTDTLTLPHIGWSYAG